MIIVKWLLGCLLFILGLVPISHAGMRSAAPGGSSFVAPFAQQVPITLDNEAITGTTIHRLVKATGDPVTGITLGIEDTSGIVGICLSNCATTGSANIATVGIVDCEFDGATTAGNYVGISSTLMGACSDVGADLPPTGEVVGQLLETIGSAGNASMRFFGIGFRSFTSEDDAQAIASRGNVVTNATSLSTCQYVGNDVVGDCTYVDGANIHWRVATDRDRTTRLSSGIPMFGVPLQILGTNGTQSCIEIHQVTGLITYLTTGDCERPVGAYSFDASAFDMLTECTIESVAHNGWPATPVLDCVDSDVGTFMLRIPKLPPNFVSAGIVTLQLTGFSITAQNALTLVVHVGAAICTGDNGQLSAFSAPSTNSATITFTNQAYEHQDSNIVTVVTTGCDAGDTMRIPFRTEDAMTAAWSTTNGHITGGMFTYEKNTN